MGADGNSWQDMTTPPETYWPSNLKLRNLVAPQESKMKQRQKYAGWMDQGLSPLFNRHQIYKVATQGAKLGDAGCSLHNLCCLL